MRILHIINSLEAGGAQKLVTDMLTRMTHNDGIEVSVVVFKISGSENERILKEAGIDIIDINAQTLSLKSLRRLIPLMKTADIVHVHLFAANYIAAIANLFARKPLIFTEHSTHNKRRDHKFLRPLEKFIYSRFNAIACISSQTAQTLTVWIGHRVADKRIITIQNGIDLSKYRNAIKRSAKETFGRDGMPILMVSRFVESKDQPTLIRALRYVKNPDAFVVFVGDGPLKARAEQIARECGVSDRVLFLGTRNDVPEIIKASAIGVQSSNWEGFGLTAVEMMAGGIPVIASDVDGLKQVVEGAGQIFPSGDDKTLANNINAILNSNSESLREMTSEGFARADCYSIDETVKNYISLYTSLSE